MDDVIPLSEAVTGRDGQSVSSLVVKKGQQVMIGIYCVNRSPKLFGDDAAKFRPERWLDGSLSNKNNKNGSELSYTAWGDMMTFLAGPRGCIGYRFSLAEIRTLTTALIANFEFLERDEGGTPIVGVVSSSTIRHVIYLFYLLSHTKCESED
jgi:cytochrome P450